MRAGVVAGCLALCAAVLGGCADRSAPSAGRSVARSSSASAVAASHAASFRYLGRVRSASRLDGGDIHLDVPPIGMGAAVSPRRAFAVCATGSGVCTTTSTATMRLALVTTTAAGTAGRDGAVDPLIDGALTYVIEWTGVPCVPVGAPAHAGSPQPSVTARACHLVDFVSARTGRYLYAFESSQ